MAHDQFYRLMDADFPFSRRLWEWFASRLVSPGGYLIIDDRAWQRFTRKAEAVSFVRDSSIGKVVFGMSVVLLVWTDGKRKVPLGLRVWQKGDKSKIELACAMLEEARKNGLTPRYVLFDSWYSCNKLLNLLSSFVWRYIGRAKVNRVLDGQKIKLLKQEFGWGKSQVGSKKAQTAHLHLGLYALCLAQMKADGQTVYQFKQNLFRQAIPTQQQFVELFTVAA